jgi:hypothetical protein
VEERTELPLAKRIVGAQPDGLHPATQLRQRHDVQHRWRPHLHLHLRSRRHRSHPAVLREQFQAEHRSLVERFSRDVDAVPHAGGPDDADRAGPKRHGRRVDRQANEKQMSATTIGRSAGRDFRYTGGL